MIPYILSIIQLKFPLLIIDFSCFPIISTKFMYQPTILEYVGPPWLNIMEAPTERTTTF